MDSNYPATGSNTAFLPQVPGANFVAIYSQRLQVCVVYFQAEGTRLYGID
jgi:hypothetical protein